MRGVKDAVESHPLPSACNTAGCGPDGDGEKGLEGRVHLALLVVSLLIAQDDGLVGGALVIQQDLQRGVPAAKLTELRRQTISRATKNLAAP